MAPESSEAMPALPARDPRGHKGTFGTVAVLGACARKRALRPGELDAGTLHMLGGPCFAAIAALRAGCGLARLLLPEPLVDHALAIAPSATAIGIPVGADGDLVAHETSSVIDSILEETSCLALGPGMGVSPGASAGVLRCITQESVPLVLDADALNNLAATRDLHMDFRAPAIVTPHPGEFERLARVLGITQDAMDEGARAEGAEALAQKLGAVVVLKGASTVVSDGQRTWSHDEPNPALATAGTGDVLTGIIAGIVAQFVRIDPNPAIAALRAKAAGGSHGSPGLSLFDAARLGVALHARAAQIWVAAHDGATGGMTAPDLLERVPEAAEGLRRGA
jgi:NAD(P)H-hydrate epimerase